MEEQRQIFTKFFIGRSDGVTFEEVSDFLTSYSIEEGDISSLGTGNTAADAVAKIMNFTLHNDENNVFSPQDQTSEWNIFNSEYQPLLFPYRKVILKNRDLKFKRKVKESITGDGVTREFKLDNLGV